MTDLLASHRSPPDVLRPKTPQRSSTSKTASCSPKFHVFARRPTPGRAGGSGHHNAEINGDDYYIIDSNSGIGHLGGFGFHDGDFNLDGYIDGDDWHVINSHYATQLLPPPIEPNSLVVDSPEPGTLRVMWTPPTLGPGETIDGYNIFESLDGVAYAQVGSVEGADTNWWEQTGLPEGAKRYYRIRAYKNGAGNSLATNEEWAVTNLPGPDDVGAVGVTSDSLTLTWRDNSRNEQTYEIFMQTGGVGDFVQIAELPGGANGEVGGTMQYDIAGLAAGQTYSFRVRATTDACDSMFSPTFVLSTLPEDPEVTLTIAGPSRINEGSVYTLDLTLGGIDATFVTNLNVNWGDGTSESIAAPSTSVTHTYDDGDASRTISAAAVAHGTTLGTSSMTVLVQDVAPMVRSSGITQIAVGEPYTLELSSRDPGDDVIASWDIDWGDGQTEPADGDAASIAHTYTTAGTFWIEATATNEDGDSSTAPIDLTVIKPGNSSATWGVGGKSAPVIDGPFVMYRATRSIDGRTVVVGANGKIARFHADGTLDTTFGGVGYIQLSSFYPAIGSIPIILPDNRIVIGGSTISSGTDIKVVRLNENGTLDQQFGQGGSITPSYGDRSAGALVDVTDNGKIVIATNSTSGFDIDTVVARFLPDGSPDATFGNGGVVTYEQTPSSSYAKLHAMTLDPAGRVLLASGISGTSGWGGSPIHYRRCCRLIV